MSKEAPYQVFYEGKDSTVIARGCKPKKRRRAYGTGYSVSIPEAKVEEEKTQKDLGDDEGKKVKISCEKP